MSLISEALKKASGAQPDTYQAAHPPPRRTVAPWLAAAVAVGVAGGVVIGFFVRHQPAPPAAAPAAPPGIEAVPSPAAGRQPAAVSGAGESAGRATTPDPVGGRVATATAPDTNAAAPATQPPPVVAQERVNTPDPEAPTAPPITQPITQPIPQPTPASPSQGSGPGAGESFHREVTLPGGARIELGGIAWSQGNPAALVNGRVLGPGEGSDDWTLTAVERDRVEIEWRGTRFFLRLK